jgi:leucine dehydrogenase
VIAGAANNQLADNTAGVAVARRGVLYAPDYVINAGGIIDIYYERVGYHHEKVLEHIDRIGHTLDTIFRMAESNRKPTHAMADRLAEERLLKRKISAVA